MKQVFSFLLAAVLTLSMSSVKAGPARPGEEKVEVIFSRQMTFADLVKIQKELADKGIVLDYRKLEFDGEGKLLAIHFLVDCGDGFTGDAQRRLTYDGRFGFFRDYAQNAQTPFGTGNFQPTTVSAVSFRSL
ncbi:MAG TPA: hypothetical protein VGE66_09505 [Chitinophagaceae bacterium]